MITSLTPFNEEYFFTFDNGNTNPHVGIFHHQQLKKVLPLQQFQEEYLRDKEKSKIVTESNILISHVGKNHPFLYLKENIFPFESLKKENLFLDMPFTYTPSIGDDRLFQSFYLYHQYFQFLKAEQNHQLILIDAGTFITIDYLSSSGLEGGYILPGIQTFLQSYQAGQNLPYYHLNDFLELFLPSVQNLPLPHSTREAILGGCQLYLEGILKKILASQKKCKIIITGGNGPVIEQILRMKVFVEEFHPHLIHHSLMFIYHYHQQRLSK